jgi:hypothetical protein
VEIIENRLLIIDYHHCQSLDIVIDSPRDPATQHYGSDIMNYLLDADIFFQDPQFTLASNPPLVESSTMAPSTGRVAKSSRSHACVLCQQRKVKCDRQNPCLGCRKANVNCVYGVSVPPKRRRKGYQESELLARLRHCEELLRSHGLKLEAFDSSNVDSSSSITHDMEYTTLNPSPEPSCRSDTFSGRKSSELGNGRLITSHGMSRYLDK